LDFFISVVIELIASGRHDKESANYLSPKISISWTAGRGVKTEKTRPPQDRCYRGSPKCTVHHYTGADCRCWRGQLPTGVRFLRTTRGLGNRGTGGPECRQG
jgi:hypothetical protein